MTITASDIYLLDVYGSALGILLVAGMLMFYIMLLSGFVWVVEVVARCPGYDLSSAGELARKLFMRFMVPGVLGVLAMVFLPSRSTIIAMYVVPRITNSDIVQRDLPKYIREFLADEARKETD